VSPSSGLWFELLGGDELPLGDASQIGSMMMFLGVLGYSDGKE